MNWDAIGAIGQIVGAVAVIVTLFYLANQIRHSTTLGIRSEMNATMQQVSAYRLKLAGDRGLAELVVKGLQSKESLDLADQMRLEMWISELAWSSFQSWHRAKLGLFEKDQWKRSFAVAMKDLLSSPAGADWWARKKTAFEPAYRIEMDAILSEKKAG